MGAVKLLSDVAVNKWPYYDDGILKIDRHKKKKGLNATERKLFAQQVHQFYCIKYWIPADQLPAQTMQDLWEAPRAVRRRWFLSLMHSLGYRKCRY